MEIYKGRLRNLIENYPKVYESLEEYIEKNDVVHLYDDFKEYIEEEIPKRGLNITFRDFFNKKYENVIVDLGIGKMFFIADYYMEAQAFGKLWRATKKNFDGVTTKEQFIERLEELKKCVTEDLEKNVRDHKEVIKERLLNEFSDKLITPEEKDPANKGNFQILDSEEDCLEVLCDGTDIGDFAIDVLNENVLDNRVDHSLFYDLQQEYFKTLYTKIGEIYIKPYLKCNEKTVEIINNIITRAVELTKHFKDICSFETCAEQALFFEIFYMTSMERLNNKTQKNNVPNIEDNLISEKQYLLNRIKKVINNFDSETLKGVIYSSKLLEVISTLSRSLNSYFLSNSNAEDKPSFDIVVKFISDKETIKKEWLFDLSKKHFEEKLSFDNGNLFDLTDKVDERFMTDIIEIQISNLKGDNYPLKKIIEIKE